MPCKIYRQLRHVQPAYRYGTPGAGGSLFRELSEGLNSLSLTCVVICSTWCQFWDAAWGPDGTGALGVIPHVRMRTILLVESGSWSK